MEAGCALSLDVGSHLTVAIWRKDFSRICRAGTGLRRGPTGWARYGPTGMHCRSSIHGTCSLRVAGLALGLYTFGSILFSGKYQQQALGASLCAAAFIDLLRHGSLQSLHRPPLEVLCYTAWVVWTGGTGFFLAVDRDLFWIAFKTVAQMLVLVWVSYIVLRLRACAERQVFTAVFCGALFQAGAVLCGMGLALESQIGTRLSGAALNPNTMSEFMILGISCLPLLWGFAPRARRWVAFWGVVALPLFGYALIASGSRKSFAALLFLLGLWGFFLLPTHHTLRAALVNCVVMGLVIVCVTLGLPLVLQSTTVGLRFQALIEMGGGSALAGVQTTSRYSMYVAGFQMFLDYPIAGVGLNNFGAHFSKRTYSHSDYIEPLATTGIVGLLLYQAFNVLLLRRSVFLLTRIRDPVERFRVKAVLASLLTLMFMGFAKPYFASQTVFVILTTFSVYTWNVQLDLQRAGRAVPRATTVSGYKGVRLRAVLSSWIAAGSQGRKEGLLKG